MGFSEVSSRYATALYNLAAEGKNQDKVFADLRAIKAIIESDSSFSDFLHSPVVKASAKEECLKQALDDKGVSAEVEKLLLLMAKKNRFAIFEDVVDAYQSRSDDAHGVTRGTVRSATVLDPAERKRIEEIVEQTTKKKVILTYKEDENVIGGLVAEVGSFTFDDTLTSHLQRLKEELKRSTH